MPGRDAGGEDLRHCVRVPVERRKMGRVLSAEGGVEMAEPTREDALLMTNLMGVSAQLGLAEANGFIWSDAFVGDHGEFTKRFPPGSKEFSYVTTVAGWFETVGTLVKHGLFNEELVHDWLAIELTWKRLES